MKKFAFVVVGMVVVGLAVSGCVSVSKYTPQSNEEDKPVMKMGGTGKEQPKVKVEVELLETPDLSRFNDSKTSDKEVTGNRGYLLGGPSTSQATSVGQEEPKAWWPSTPEETVNTVAETIPQVVEEKPVMTKYKVKKGQTLADVSKDVYGTTKKWKKIYEANKAKIKNPDKIYAGQVLNIPQEENSVKHLK